MSVSPLAEGQLRVGISYLALKIDKMTFTYEKIDESRRQELLAKLPRSYVLALSACQVIDRERDRIFLCLGGRGDEPKTRGQPPTGYALLWKGLVVLCRGYDDTRFPENRVIAEIDLEEWRLPASLMAAQEEVRTAIIEALAVLWSGCWERPAVITVRFPTPTVVR